MAHLQTPQHEHLAVALVHLALQIAGVIVLANRDGLVIILLPLALEVEGGLELMCHILAVNVVVEEGQVHIDLVILLVDAVGELEQDIAVIVLVTLGTNQV